MAHIPVRHPSGALYAPQSTVLSIGQRFGSNLNIHFHVALERQIIPLGERHLCDTVAEYIEHYYAERNHQGLGNQLILKPRDGTCGGRTGGRVR